MRLINVDTRKLEKFSRGHAPPYVILSHRWGRKEVSYASFQRKRKDRLGSRLDKIEGLCETVQRLQDDQVQHAWIDSCCIDQRNSAEVDEAINSMFDLYSHAKVCYAFLGDVEPKPLYEQQHADDSLVALYPHLSSSEWFTRGWTLQELLAPQTVIFFDSGWNIIGHKCCLDCCPCFGSGNKDHDPNLNNAIASFTGIHPDFLSGARNLSTASTACKLSWAAFRRTTKEEDEAYCLQGLLGVNMRTVYGEGRKQAFARLQRRLLADTTDQSLLAWTAPPEPQSWPSSHLYVHKLLATNTTAFLSSINVQPGAETNLKYAVKNYGIKLRANAQQISHRIRGAQMTVYFVKLDCLYAINGSTDWDNVEIALTDGSDKLNPTPSALFYRIYASDFGQTLRIQFPESQRAGPFDRVFRIAADHDDILRLSKL